MYYVTPFKIFTSVLIGGLSLKSEWQVSMTLLNILTNLNNCLNSSSDSWFIQSLENIPRAPTIIGITIGGARGVMVIVVGNGHGDTRFKSWTRLVAFHMALIPLEKVWIQLFSFQLWLNSRADWVLQPWWGN